MPEAWLQSADEGPAWLLTTRAAAGTDAEAQYELGLEYLRGTKLPENVRLAAHWLHQAADAGHAKACYLMAILTREGEGSAPSVARFLAYLRRAAEQGLELAQVELGKLHARGLLVPRDLVRARHLLHLAANSGDPAAMKELARLPAALLSKPHEADAALWWARAAAAGDGEALCEVARRAGEVPSRRLELLSQAAALQQPEALRQLGELQRMPSSAQQGGPRRDCAKAAESLAEACELWRAQASKLREEVVKRDTKWFHALAEFDEELDSYLIGQHVLVAWHRVASRRRQLLRKCIARCETRWQRSAWARWDAGARCNDRSPSVVLPPFTSTVLLQRILSHWRLAAVGALEVPDFRVRLKSSLRKLFALWACVSVTKRPSARILCSALKSRILCTSRSCILHWHVHVQHSKGATRLARWARRHCLQRCCAPALGTWQRYSVAVGRCAVASKQQEAELQLESLRLASEELLAQHRIELDSWRLRCEEEKAFVEAIGCEHRGEGAAEKVIRGHCVEESGSFASDEGRSHVSNAFDASGTENASTLALSQSAPLSRSSPKASPMPPSIPELPALGQTRIRSANSSPAPVRRERTGSSLSSPAPCLPVSAPASASQIVPPADALSEAVTSSPAFFGGDAHTSIPRHSGARQGHRLPHARGRYSEIHGRPYLKAPVVAPAAVAAASEDLHSHEWHDIQSELNESEAMGCASMANYSKVFQELRSDIAVEVERTKVDPRVSDQAVIEVETRINDCIGRLEARLHLGTNQRSSIRAHSSPAMTQPSREHSYAGYSRYAERANASSVSDSSQVDSSCGRMRGVGRADDSTWSMSTSHGPRLRNDSGGDTISASSACMGPSRHFRGEDDNSSASDAWSEGSGASSSSSSSSGDSPRTKPKVYVRSGLESVNAARPRPHSIGGYQQASVEAVAMVSAGNTSTSQRRSASAGGNLAAVATPSRAGRPGRETQCGGAELWLGRFERQLVTAERQLRSSGRPLWR